MFLLIWYFHLTFNQYDIFGSRSNIVVEIIVQNIGICILIMMDFCMENIWYPHCFMFKALLRKLHLFC